MNRGRRGEIATSRGLVVLLAVGVGACCAATPPPVRPGAAPTADQLLRALGARQAALRSMNARARATSWVGGDRVRATVLMLADRTGRLRFEAEISLQGTVSILTTDDGRFQLLDLRNNQLQQGPACPANVASLIRIPLLPAEVGAILLGDASLPPAIAPADLTVAWDAARGADVLVAKRSGASGANGVNETRIFFRPDGEHAEIIGAAASGPDGPLWRASYEDFTGAAGGLRLPSLIRFAERAGSFDDGVEIRFKDRTPNAEIPPESFRIAPPPGTKVVDVGCAGDYPAPAAAAGGRD
jgi:hypothetical protein